MPIPRRTVENRYSLKFTPHAGVYGPEEDTILFLDVLENVITSKGGLWVEFGCGTGIGTMIIARALGYAIGVDINPNAVENTIQNARMNGLAVDAILASTPSIFRSGSVDGFAFNPPYLPDDGISSLDWLTRSIYGGPHGVDVALEFIKEATGVLKSGGEIIILLSSLGDLAMFESAAKRYGYSLKILEEKYIGGFESLIVYHLILR